jgi:hypothetical protein
VCSHGISSLGTVCTANLLDERATYLYVFEWIRLFNQNANNEYHQLKNLHEHIYILLYYIVLYCVILYYIILSCNILYYIILYCIILYCIILYNIILYCIMLNDIILYYIRLD